MALAYTVTWANTIVCYIVQSLYLWFRGNSGVLLAVAGPARAVARSTAVRGKEIEAIETLSAL